MSGLSVFKKNLESSFKYLDKAEQYLVGVSGGLDSVTLLHLLKDFGFKKLIVCHFNHGLRGSESDTDEKFVSDLAASFDFQFVSQKQRIKNSADLQSESREAAARSSRYNFFARVAKSENCFQIFLGHHADDQIETFLFNLFRGTGTRGLGAMRVESTQAIRIKPDNEMVKLKLIRPLLGVWRKDLENFAKEKAIKFRQDKTNESLNFTRNRLRHQIIPQLSEAFGREVKPALWRTARILADEDAVFDQFLAKELAKVQGAAEIDLGWIKSFPPASQRRILKAWLKGNKIPNVGYKEVELTRELITDKSKINLPGGNFARRRNKKLFHVGG